MVGLKLTKLSRILGYKCVKEREREREGEREGFDEFVGYSVILMLKTSCLQPNIKTFVVTKWN